MKHNYIITHTVLGDRHLSTIREKVSHCQINLDSPTDRNASLETKAQRQIFRDIVFQINICDRPYYRVYHLIISCSIEKQYSSLHLTTSLYIFVSTMWKMNTKEKPLREKPVKLFWEIQILWEFILKLLKKKNICLSLTP